MENAIEVTNLTKHYGSITAVDGVTFRVARGEFFGLLGPNGAGKTTTIRMLTGLARPTSGHARVLGFDLLKDITRIKKLRLRLHHASGIGGSVNIVLQQLRRY